VEGKAYLAGCCAHTDAAIFSFHPVKHITTGEGGAVTTNDEALYHKLRELRTHGIHKDSRRLQRSDEGPWYYEQDELGYNYRITDLQCALGLSQISKLGRFLERRRAIARLYDEALAQPPLERWLRPLRNVKGASHAYHLYVAQVQAPDLARAAALRRDLYLFLRESKILTQVHYIPVHWQPYYRRHDGSRLIDCPGANAYYAGCLSLPLYPLMSEADVQRVIRELAEWTTRNRPY
jgi:dTDP-4-amino-4,6-dideoxygalactose transaminase